MYPINKFIHTYVFACVCVSFGGLIINCNIFQWGKYLGFLLGDRSLESTSEETREFVAKSVSDLGLVTMSKMYIQKQQFCQQKSKTAYMEALFQLTVSSIKTDTQ